MLEDAGGWELRGSWAEHPFPLPPGQGYDWQEEHYTVPEDTVDPGFSVRFSFQWSLTITDEARDASVAYYGDTHRPMNIIRCTEGEEIRYYCYELPREERDPNALPDNQPIFWTLVTDAAAEARNSVGFSAAMSRTLSRTWTLKRISMPLSAMRFTLCRTTRMRCISARSRALPARSAFSGTRRPYRGVWPFH